MAAKKTANYDDLFADLDDISAAGSDATSSSKRVSKPANAATDITSAEDDPLAELTALASARPSSRPSTPRLSSSTTSGNTSSTGRQKTPASSGAPSARTSMEQSRTTLPVRQSTESTRGYHQPQNASVEEAAESETSQAVKSSAETARPYETETREAASPIPSAGGGWWGSVFTAASAAVKQAEAAVNEIRGNEEAQKWAQQVKGNVDVLKQYSNVP